jgi:hypothetical protein
MDGVDATNLHFVYGTSHFQSLMLGGDGLVYISNLPTSAGGPSGSLYQLAGVVMVN